MAVPTIVSATYTGFNGYLTIVWSEAVTPATIGANSLLYQRNTSTLLMDTGSVVSGSGTATLVYRPTPASPSVGSITTGTISVAPGIAVSVSTSEGNAGVSAQAVTITGGELIQVSDVQTRLGITGSDALIGQIILEAEGMMADWADRRDASVGMVGTGPRWLSGVFTETLPGALRSVQQLRYWPVTAISGVTVVTSTVSSTAVAPNLYRIDNDQVRVRFIGTWQVAWEAGLTPSGLYAGQQSPGPIETSYAYPYTQITYTGGFTAGSVPPALTSAAIRLACMMFQTAKRDLTLTGENFGDYSYTADPHAWTLFQEDFINNVLSTFRGFVLC